MQLERCAIDYGTHRGMMHKADDEAQGSGSSLMARHCTSCSHFAHFKSHCGFGMLREQKEEGRVRGKGGRGR